MCTNDVNWIIDYLFSLISSIPSRMQNQAMCIPKVKSYYIKPLKDKNICCCKYHVELDMLKVSLNFLRDPKKGMHEKLRCHCHCNVYSSIGESRDLMCSVLGKVYKGITQLQHDCVCGKGELEKWHRCECLLGEPHNCGVDKLPLCLNEVASNSDYKVSWGCFETSVVGQFKEKNQRSLQGDLYIKVSNLLETQFAKNC